jgi:hypothetical protein
MAIDKILICLSKTGDLCNILPIAYSAHLKGERYGIMASSEYGNLLDGISYAEKIIFNGKPWSIKEAVGEAKKICPEVVCVMTNGPKESIEEFSYKPAGQLNAVTDSFSREAYKIAGCLKDWGKYSLNFDLRNPDREKLLLQSLAGPKNKKKIILISAGSESSPFPYRNLLLELVNLKYGKSHRVINLANVNADRFYDLICLYEAAHCLITVDTAHLHLAAAVPNLPVMALIQDRPIYWYGSAWRPQHHFFCRYKDFPRRALEMFTAIENIGVQVDSNILQVYYGSVRKNNGVRYFPIQYGACKRDAVNVLDDKEHYPMLQDSIRMMMQVARPNDIIRLTREDVVVESDPETKEPCFAWRTNRDKAGNDTFFPAVDLFAAPVDFWVKIFKDIPDVVMSTDSYWGLLLMQIFKKYGAVDVGGIYRLD